MPNPSSVPPAATVWLSPSPWLAAKSPKLHFVTRPSKCYFCGFISRLKPPQRHPNASPSQRFFNPISSLHRLLCTLHLSLYAQPFLCLACPIPNILVPIAPKPNGHQGRLSPWTCMAILTMPFLRRRGNLASEAESSMRQPQNSTTSENGTDTFTATYSDGLTTDLDGHAATTQPSRSNSTTSRPDTSHNHDDISRQKRFSLLRFRNASDSQLSLKAKQQADQLPPLPPLPPSTNPSISATRRNP